MYGTAENKPATAVTGEQPLVDALARRIERRAQEGWERLCLDRLYEGVPLSRRQTERLFRERFLTSPARYFRDCQTAVAERLLANGRDVLSATAESGFASPSRLHDALVTRRGLTPGEVRKRGAGVAIDYGFFDTPLGIALLAATGRGLCALRLCQFSGAEAKRDELRGDYPAADLRECAETAQLYADALVNFLEARAATFRPPLDLLAGTTFQREVWAELQRVAPGETLSYTELAARVGRPRAVRAVAGACARNHIAIAIPCHRIVSANGSLAGYRWGKEWKRRLLDLEAEFARRRGADAAESTIP